MYDNGRSIITQFMVKTTKQKVENFTTRREELTRKTNLQRKIRKVTVRPIQNPC